MLHSLKSKAYRDLADLAAPTSEWNAVEPKVSAKDVASPNSQETKGVGQIDDKDVKLIGEKKVSERETLKHETKPDCSSCSS